MRPLTALLLLTAGCCPPPSTCEWVVRGACVNESQVLPVVGLDRVRVAERLDYMIVWGADFWQVDPNTILRDWHLILQDRISSCGSTENAGGCSIRFCHEIELAAPSGVPSCVVQSLPHEMGHVVLEDPHHRDPRWKQLEAVEPYGFCDGS
jgi:hypothetical protein